MKTTSIHNGPDIPIFRMANCILFSAIQESFKEIKLSTTEPRLTYDGQLGAPPPAHLGKHLFTPFIKYAGVIKWPWTKKINGKRFCTLFEGKAYHWLLKSDDIDQEIVIQKLENEIP